MKQMNKKKHFFVPVTAIILFIILTFNACSPAEKNNNAGAQASAVSSEVESPAGNSDGSAGNDGTEEGSAGVNSDTDKETVDTLEDGSYVPTMFTVSGGTGKVKITCPEVVLTEGEALARVEFSSPHYDWVKVDGVQYDPENAGDADRENSVFNIPVLLDQEMTISGLTTAMSEPHEIEYTLFISLTREDETTAAGGVEGDEGEDGSESTAGKAPEADGDSISADSGSISSDGEDAPAAGRRSSGTGSVSQPPALEGLTFVSAMETSYAETFDIYSYKPADGSTEDLYRLIDVHESGQYLLLPEKTGADKSDASQKILKNLHSSITVLQAPLDNIYVAATSSMALFDGAGAISQVKLTGTKEEGWHIDAPKKALADGSMVYAGKYSAPDYELLASSGCDLAVESMMILHSPEVKEKLEELGIPVFIDTSSNESHPLGRTEWVRLYGVLTGHETEAEAFFAEQEKEFAKAENYNDTGLTVAFFSISSNGNVIVRATDDYIPRMIELAGGNYIFKDLLQKSGNSASVRLSMEDFYNTAKDADYLIYNATIENPVRSISELCGKSALLADFKAVQNGNVWQVQRSLYQSPDIAAQMITDLHLMLTGENTSQMTFLEQLK